MFNTDYLSGASSLAPFYKYSAQNPDFLEIIKDKTFSKEKRETLVEVLREQYVGIENAEKSLENIEKLLLHNAYTLTTGHQLCFMGGPMFTHYKVMTAINLAEELNQKHSDFSFIPVFWIHTEDHDFAEINHFFADFITKKKYDGEFIGAVGRHIISEKINDILPKNLRENLKKCFVIGKSWAQAYRLFMHELFGKYGIVMLDADDKRLKAFFSPILKAELQEKVTQKCILQTNAELLAAGYNPQVQPQPINLFYVDEKGRNRIEVIENEASEKVYHLVNRPEITFSATEILDLAQNSPQLFSPNVCLRPLYQETILPNLAYIGGWAEVAYWLQFKGVFAHFKLNFPLVMPRFSATLFSENDAETWQKLGFTLPEISKNIATIWEEYAQKHESIGAFEAWKQEISQVWQKGATLFPENTRLTSNILGEQKKFEHFFKNFQKKQGHFLREKNPIPYHQLRNIKLATQPDNTVQERVLSIIAFSEMGYEKVLSLIKSACKPLDYQHFYGILKD